MEKNSPSPEQEQIPSNTSREGPAIPSVSQRGRPKDPGKRCDIVRAARQLFMQHGVGAVSMDTIASAAGVSKKTIYSHFPCKEDLFFEVMGAESAQFQTAVLDPDSLRDRTGLRESLIAWGVQFVTMLSRPSIIDLGNLLVSESRRHPELARQFLTWGPEEKWKMLSAYLAKAHDLGLLSIPESEVAADQLFSLWQGMWHLRQQMGVTGPPSEAWIKDHCAKGVDLVLKGYRAEDPAMRPPVLPKDERRQR